MRVKEATQEDFTIPKFRGKDLANKKVSETIRFDKPKLYFVVKEVKMQKFKKGDHVQVAKDLGESMSHFTNDCEAIVIGSYADEYGGENTGSYTIHIKGSGETSWYYEDQLELIESEKFDLLKAWTAEKEHEARIKSDLNWIFSHGKEVLEGAHGSTVTALAKCFGLTDLWGSSGEGFTYYRNAMKTIEAAKPFLETGDKDGWLNHCKTIKV